MDEESNTFNFNKSALNSSNQESHHHILELARLQLKEYDDIDDEELLVEEEDRNKPSLQSYLNVPQHNQTSIVVPLGAMYQVALPPILSANSYRLKSEMAMKKLALLKIHDPEVHEAAYLQHREMVEELYGRERTYEDFATVYNCYRQVPLECTFPEYLKDEGICRFWEKTFKDKDKVLLQKAKKKKKKKGTIPV